MVGCGGTRPVAKPGGGGGRGLAKAGLQIKATTYGHALRTNGITDKVHGYGSLLARF